MRYTIEAEAATYSNITNAILTKLGFKFYIRDNLTNEEILKEDNCKVINIDTLRNDYVTYIYRYNENKLPIDNIIQILENLRMLYKIEKREL